MSQQRVETVMSVPVRVVTVDGVDWWCAADLSRAFGASQDGGQFTRGMPEELHSLQSLETPGGLQSAVCVTWAGVGFLAGHCRAPEATAAFKALLAGLDRTLALVRSSAAAVTVPSAPSLDPQQLAAAVAKAVTEAVGPAIMRGMAQSRRDAAWEKRQRREEQPRLPGMEVLPLSSPAPPLGERILAELAAAGPLSTSALKARCHARREFIQEETRKLEADGRILRTGTGSKTAWVLSAGVSQ